MTPVEMFLTALYVGTCLGLYGVISLISWFEDEYINGEIVKDRWVGQRLK